MQMEVNSQSRRRWWHVVEALLWVGFFAGAVILIGLRYWILPNVERYRPEIVEALSSALGLPVEIGSIEAGWNGVYPRLDITQLRIRDREGREALVLPAVEGELSWRALLQGRFGLHSFAIERPQLVVRRSPEGTLFVAGLRIDPDGDDGAFTDWLLSQREIMIRDASVVWQDDLRGAPPLELQRLDLRLRNDGDDHRLGVSALPPANLGAALDLRAEVSGSSIRELTAWNGRFFVELGSTDLAAWRAWVDYPIEVREGRGALRLWLTLDQGKLLRATADLQLDGVAARLSSDLPMLQLASIHGRLQGRNAATVREISARDLQLALEGGSRMAPTSFRFTQTAQAGEAGFPRGRFQATRLDFAPLATVAAALPFPAELRDRLAELELRGALEGLDMDWHGELPQARQYSLKTGFSGLAMNAWRALPGFAGMSGQVELTQKGGILRLTSSGAQLLLPRIFPDPALRLDSLIGRIDWDVRDTTQLAVRLRNLEFASEHLAGTASGSYEYAGSGPGSIDLNAQLLRADARHVARYLPHGSIMNEPTREWLAAAIVSGRSNDARVRIKGNLRDFPFVDSRKGDFQATARVTGGTLNYGSAWPRIEAIDADLRFDRGAMRITGRAGSILGARLSAVKVEIPDLVRPDTHVLVDGQVEGPSSDFLRYIASSPVRAMIDGATDTLSASGRGRLRLKLDLPLADLSKTEIAGDYQFAGNTLVVHPQLPSIERAGGRLAFSENSFSIQDLRGQFLGGAVAVSGGTRAPGETAITARGEATVAGLRALLDHPWRNQLSGSAPYTATLSIARGGRLQIGVETSLRGIGSELPPPLSKRAADTLPLRIDVFPGEGGTRDRISLALGNVGAGEFLRQREGERMTVRRAGIALSGAQGSVRLPERNGTLITGSLAQFDLDRWQPHLGGGEVGSTAIDVRIGALDALGRRITEASIRAGIDAEGWSANISAEELAGDLVFRSAGRGKLTARLAHFRLPEASPGARPGTTKELPALDIVAERFTHRGKPLGRVELQAQNEAGLWNVEKLSSVSPESAFAARGRWRSGGNPASDMEFTLDVNNIGRFMDRMGFKDTVSGGTAKLAGSLHWAGDPTEVNYPSLSGNVSLEAQNGQILEIEPGIGKLLSLLKFDLSSTFNKGFAFNQLNAGADIERGIATIKEFRMRGSAADIFVQGTTQLAQETQDLRVRVVPSLGDGVSSLSGFVWGPIVGVATLLAQRLLKNPLGEIFAAEYRITGSWSDPKVERAGASVARPGAENGDAGAARAVSKK